MKKQLLKHEVFYNGNGSVSFEGSYKNGDYHGFCRFYGSDGKVSFEREFRNGQFHGFTRVFNEVGFVTKIQYYKKDVLIFQELTKINMDKKEKPCCMCDGFGFWFAEKNGKEITKKIDCGFCKCTGIDLS